MRLSYSLGSLLTVEQVLACSKKLNDALLILIRILRHAQRK